MVVVVVVAIVVVVTVIVVVVVVVVVVIALPIYAHPQGLTCATEVQVVHALLATDCVVQDAVHLLLNTT